jgi:hypothetical protein
MDESGTPKDPSEGFFPAGVLKVRAFKWVLMEILGFQRTQNFLSGTV